MNANNLLKKLNGNRYTILSLIGGVLLATFAMGGAWFSTKDSMIRLTGKLNNHVSTHDQYVGRHELQLTLAPIKQDIENIKQSLQEMKTRQEEQNQQILQAIRESR